MAARFFEGSSKRALIALAFPLAALVPVAVPFDALAGAFGQAEAATIKKVKRKVVAVKKPATTRKVCTVTRVKGRKATRCKTVRIVPVLPVMATSVTPLAPPQVTYVTPPPVSNAVAYYWIDQADSLAQAFGNSPPDFTFDYGGIDCWAWISRDGEVLIVEPGRDGVRQYFYAPHQTSPYLARDSYASFAFDGRDLVQAYDYQGRLYTGLTSQARYDGEALQQRGRALYAASMRQRRWDRGSAATWIGGYSSLGYYDSGWNSGWSGAWRELPDWDRYDHDRRRQHPPRHLDDEHRDRDDARRRYDQWHRRGDQGAPPPTGNPVVTPTDAGGTGLPPVRPLRPAPRPQPQPQPPLAEPPPVPEAAPPVPSDAPAPRGERPRREIELEPGAPPIPLRRTAPQPYQQPEQPVVQIQTVPEPPPVHPDPVPVPMPVPVYSPPPPPPAPVPQWRPAPMPAPTPAPAPAAVQTPAPVFVPPAAPAPPPPPPPPREQIMTENPSSDTDRP